MLARFTEFRDQVFSDLVPVVAVVDAHIDDSLLDHGDTDIQKLSDGCDDQDYPEHVLSPSVRLVYLVSGELDVVPFVAGEVVNNAVHFLPFSSRFRTNVDTT